MNDPRSGEGGAANTPPFPRLVDDDAPSEGERGDRPEPTAAGDDTRITAEAVARPVIDHPLVDRPAESRADRDDEEARTGDRSRAATDREGTLRRAANRAGDELRRRADQRVQRGFERVADRLEEAAERIDRFAEAGLASGGARRRAAGVAQNATGAIEDVAGYLRASDLPTMRSDLERHVREKPLQSLLVAIGAGWLLGRILR